MTKSLVFGPNGTPVGGVSEVAITVAPLNYAADFRRVEEGASKIVYTDVTAPQDQPSTIRIAQQSRPNVYAGTTIDPSVFLPNKRGTDTIIEVREVWSEVDSADTSYLRMFPVRAALTLTVPDASQVTVAAVQRVVQRLFAALAEQGEANTDSGIAALLHGVVCKD